MSLCSCCSCSASGVPAEMDRSCSSSVIFFTYDTGAATPNSFLCLHCVIVIVIVTVFAIVIVIVIVCRYRYRVCYRNRRRVIVVHLKLASGKSENYAHRVYSCQYSGLLGSRPFKTNGLAARSSQVLSEYIVIHLIDVLEQEPSLA